MNISLYWRNNYGMNYTIFISYSTRQHTGRPSENVLALDGSGTQGPSLGGLADELFFEDFE